MAILKRYKVVVVIPNIVADEIGGKINKDDYEKKCLKATKGSITAGSNWYSLLEEWGEFSTLEDAQACERKLLDVIYYFAAKLEGE